MKNFINAVKGIVYILNLREKIFSFQIAAAVVAAVFAIYFPLTLVERAVIAVCAALVLGLETMNTAIEKMLDFFHPEFHKKIGFIKDLAAGAVLIVSLGTAAAGILIFLPHILNILF